MRSELLSYTLKREHLFRGKGKNDNKWHEGYLFKHWDKTYILWGMTDDVPNMVEVVPESVGEYTESNDVADEKIFTGDKVRCRAVFEGEVEIGTVFFDCIDSKYSILIYWGERPITIDLGRAFDVRRIDNE